jgi:hypothetical protein
MGARPSLHLSWRTTALWTSTTTMQGIRRKRGRQSRQSLIPSTPSTSPTRGLCQDTKGWGLVMYNSPTTINAWGRPFWTPPFADTPIDPQVRTVIARTKRIRAWWRSTSTRKASAVVSKKTNGKRWLPTIKKHIFFETCATALLEECASSNVAAA